VAPNDCIDEPDSTGIECVGNHTGHSRKRTAFDPSPILAPQQAKNEEAMNKAEHPVMERKKRNEEELDPMTDDSRALAVAEVVGHSSIFAHDAFRLRCIKIGRIPRSGEHFQNIDCADDNIFKPVEGNDLEHIPLPKEHPRDRQEVHCDQDDQGKVAG